jgi:hypothetical protein
MSNVKDRRVETMPWLEIVCPAFISGRKMNTARRENAIPLDLKK